MAFFWLRPCHKSLGRVPDTARPRWRASSPPANAQGSVRFAHRTLSLHVTLPETPLWNKEKLGRTCEEAVELVPFLWKWKEKAGRNSALHRVEFSPGAGKSAAGRKIRSSSFLPFEPRQATLVNLGYLQQLGGSLHNRAQILVMPAQILVMPPRSLRQVGHGRLQAANVGRQQLKRLR